MNTHLSENRNLYKVFLSVVKYIPTIVAIIHVIASILHYFKIATTWLACFGGTSIIFIVLLYIISYVFKFCYLYRVPLWYITVMMFLNIFRSIGILSLEVLVLYRIYASVFGFFLVVFIIYMYKNRKNPKVDPIKQLCENYVDCSC